MQCIPPSYPQYVTLLIRSVCATKNFVKSLVTVTAKEGRESYHPSFGIMSTRENNLERQQRPLLRQIMGKLKYPTFGHQTSMFSGFKEACYSQVPVGISLQINDFPMLTVLEICFIPCRSSHESNCTLSRPSKCPL